MRKYRELRRCLPPFSDCYASGPTLDKSHGRLNIKLLGKWGGTKKTSKTYLYSRYLFCVYTGKVVPEGFDVDHVDGNKRNDTIPNLRMIPHVTNLQKSSTDPSALAQHRYVRLTCLECGVVFVKHRNGTHLTKRQHATYCSSKCGHSGRMHMEEEQKYEEFVIASAPSEHKYEPWDDWSNPLEERPKAERTATMKACWCRACRNNFQSANKKSRYCSEDCKAKGPVTRKEDSHEKNVEVLTQACNCKITWVKAGKLLGMSGNAAKKRARKLGMTIPRKTEPSGGIEPSDLLHTKEVSCH